MTKRAAGPVILDLEFTAWEDSMQHRWTRPGEFREVVQIGAVKLSPRDLRQIDEFDMLVVPRLNPMLSPFFSELTGITNDDLARRGVDFITAFRAFLDFAGSGPVWAFGRDDLVLEGNLRLCGWQRQMSLPPYTNVVLWLLEQGIDMRGKHACDVAEAAGAEFSGRAHNALADARGVAAGIRALVEKGAPNPFVISQTA